MKKIILIILLLFSCKTNINKEINLPSWLIGQWNGSNKEDKILTLTFTNDNIVFFYKEKEAIKNIKEFYNVLDEIINKDKYILKVKGENNKGNCFIFKKVNKDLNYEIYLNDELIDNFILKKIKGS